MVRWSAVHVPCPPALPMPHSHTSKLQQTSTNPSRQKLEIVDAKAILLLNTPTCVCVCTKTPSAWQVTPTSPKGLVPQLPHSHGASSSDTG